MEQENVLIWWKHPFFPIQGSIPTHFFPSLMHDNALNLNSKNPKKSFGRIDPEYVKSQPNEFTWILSPKFCVCFGEKLSHYYCSNSFRFVLKQLPEKSSFRFVGFSSNTGTWAPHLLLVLSHNPTTAK